MIFDKRLFLVKGYDLDKGKLPEIRILSPKNERAINILVRHKQEQTL